MSELCPCYPRLFRAIRAVFRLIALENALVKRAMGCPPKAKARGSNPLGCANILKDLAEIFERPIFGLSLVMSVLRSDVALPFPERLASVPDSAASYLRQAVGNKA